MNNEEKRRIRIITGLVCIVIALILKFVPAFDNLRLFQSLLWLFGGANLLLAIADKSKNQN